MTQSSPNFSHADTHPSPAPLPMAIDFLEQDLVVADLDVASRKRLFEAFAMLISEKYDDDLEFEGVLKTLNDRERLGSTGLGNGIALPHGRLEGLASPVISIAKLEQPIDYDTPDDQPVWLAICLLVPADANDVHLQLLAQLAARFHDKQFIDILKRTGSSSELYLHFSDI